MRKILIAAAALALAACSDGADLPESMKLTGTAGTAVGDGQCDHLVGVPPAALFVMNIRNHSDPATCTCFTDQTGLAPCSFDGDHMSCTWGDPPLVTWSVDFDPEAMTAHVVTGACSVDATVTVLTEN